MRSETGDGARSVKLLFYICVISGFILNGAARGATYTYTFTAGTPTLTGSTTESLPIYLHEASSDGSSQVNNDGGLYSFGFTATVMSGPATISNLTRNSAFDSLVTTGPNASTSSFPATQGKLYAMQDNNFGQGVLVDSSGDAVVATIYFSNVSSATTFALADINPVGSQTVDYDGESLDPTSTTSVTIGAPEPSAAIPAIIVGLSWASRRRRSSVR